MKENIKTTVVHGSKGYDPVTGSVSFPIYQSATFKHPGLNESTGYDYSRLQNPTREELEKTLAKMDNCEYGFAFSSGMAAVTTLVKLFKSGDHLVISDDLYGGVYRLFEGIYSNFGIETTYVDITDIDSIENAIKKNTKGIFFETPTNPMLKIADIEKISKISKDKNILTIVDNTLLTPYLQQPLALGADLVVYSGTKFLAGHNDLLAGFITTNNSEIAEKIQYIQISEGAILSPFDSWLTLRGIKTLSVRMDRQIDNSKKVYEFLKKHPLVEQVFYDNTGAMISFYVVKEELVKRILGSVELIYFAESLGGCETLITFPSLQTHDAIPKEIRDRLGVNDKLLRLSIGIEDIEDIIDDLKNALGE